MKNSKLNQCGRVFLHVHAAWLYKMPGAFSGGSPFSVPAASFAPPSAQITNFRPVAGHGGIPASGAVAAVVNLTATRASRAGSLSAYPRGTSTSTSVVNFAAARSTANLAIVPLGADGRIVLRNDSAGATDVLVDVIGYFQ